MKACLIALALVLGVSSVLAQTPVCPKYVVQQGDSLFSITQKFNILTPDELTASLLACGQSSELLQIGQEICLPGADKPGCTNVKNSGNNAQCKVYVVQQGDTIESVATSLDLFRDTLDQLNKDVQTGGILQPNKYLKLPPWTAACGDPNSSGESCRLYKVISGDFIAGIAAAYGVTVEQILAVNPELNANSVLQNSQPVKIPPFPASCGSGTISKPPTDTVLKCRGYRVQQGDNIQQIALDFKTTVSEINDANPDIAGGALVQPGTVIKIPPYDSTCDQPIVVDTSAPTTSSPGASPAPVVPVPVPVVPVPVASPSPVALSPPVVASPPPSPVAVAPVAPIVPVAIPSPAAAPAPAPVEVIVPVNVTEVATPPPPSAAIAPKAAFAALVAVVMAMAL